MLLLPLPCFSGPPLFQNLFLQSVSVTNDSRWDSRRGRSVLCGVRRSTKMLTRLNYSLQVKSHCSVLSLAECCSAIKKKKSSYVIQSAWLMYLQSHTRVYLNISITKRYFHWSLNIPAGADSFLPFAWMSITPPPPVSSQLIRQVHCVWMPPVTLF